MRFILASTLFILTIHSVAQTDTLKVHLIGFNKNHELRLYLDRKEVEVNSSGNLLISKSINTSKPILCELLFKDKLYAFFVDIGGTEAFVYKEGLPASIKVPGSRSDLIYKSVFLAKTDEEALTNTLKFKDRSIALAVFNLRFQSFHKYPLEDLRYLYESTPDTLKKFLPILEDFLEVVDQKKLHVGHQISDFKAWDLKGDTISTVDFRGDYLLIQFSSTRCTNCPKSEFNLNKLYKNYKNLKVVTFMQFLDDGKWMSVEPKRDFLANWPIVWTGFKSNRILFKYSVSELPAYCLISPNGKILESWSGSTKKAIERVLEMHLVKYD